MQLSSAPAAAVVVLGLLAAACQNDYDQFNFGVGGASGDSGVSGGAGGTSSGGAGGSSGASSCAPGELHCDGRCVSRDNRENCGSCGNDCTALGFGAGFVCVDGACGCGISSRCGEAPAQCRAAGGPCECGGTECNPGEACDGAGDTQSCSCNGGAACADGETCSSSGCG